MHFLVGSLTGGFIQQWRKTGVQQTRHTWLSSMGNIDPHWPSEWSSCVFLIYGDHNHFYFLIFNRIADYSSCIIITSQILILYDTVVRMIPTEFHRWVVYWLQPCVFQIFVCLSSHLNEQYLYWKPLPSIKPFFHRKSYHYAYGETLES